MYSQLKKDTKILYLSIAILYTFSTLIFSCNEPNEALLELPKIYTENITEITDETALSGGKLENDGGTKIISKGIVWSINPNPTISLPTKTEEGEGMSDFVSLLSNLSYATTYHVRAYATNSVGTAYGNELTFNTANTSPTIITSDIEYVTSYRAISGGQITSDGGAAITSKGVVWDTKPNPTTSLSTKTNEGSGDANFSSNIRGLIADTKYYLRAYATNSSGTSYGIELSFTTDKYPVLFDRLYSDIFAYEMNSTSDGGFIIAGNKIFHNGYGSFLMKVDSLGSEQWTTSVEGSGNEAHQGNVFQIDDSGYLLSNERSIQRFDQNGKLEWLKNSPSWSLNYNSVVRLEDGNYIAAGVDGTNGNTGTLIKLDQNGNEIWQKYFNENSITTCQYICASSDGNFIVIGGAGRPYSTTLAASKVDNEGNVLWTKFYEHPFNSLITSVKAKVQQLNPTTFIISAINGTVMGGMHTRILSIDNDGDLNWEKDLALGYFTACRSLIKLNEGELLLVGSNEISAYSNRTGLIAKLDTFGNLIWSKMITSEEIDYTWEFQSVVETSGKTLTLLGTKAYTYSGTERGLWLLRTDSEGEQ
jgi:hypothetical protein